MFTRFRLAFGVALLITLVTSTTVFAKGNFAFIGISGPDLKETIRSTDPALTSDFFAFADFHRGKADAPADPGPGYEITRYYVDGRRETAFDHLHYYPDTGFVYYDGIAKGGSSEYDGKWYTAKPEIKAVFESALSQAHQSAASPALIEKKQPVTSGAQPENPVVPSQPVRSSLPTLPVVAIGVGIGLVALFVFAVWRRKPALR